MQLFDNFDFNRGHSEKSCFWISYGFRLWLIMVDYSSLQLINVFGFWFQSLITEIRRNSSFSWVISDVGLGDCLCTSVVNVGCECWLWVLVLNVRFECWLWLLMWWTLGVNVGCVSWFRRPAADLGCGFCLWPLLIGVAQCVHCIVQCICSISAALTFIVKCDRGIVQCKWCVWQWPQYSYSSCDKFVSLSCCFWLCGLQFRWDDRHERSVD